jgi:hypothetical protein
MTLHVVLVAIHAAAMVALGCRSVTRAVDEPASMEGWRTSATCDECAADRAEVIEGLTRVRFDALMSRVEADRAHFVPLVWGSALATGGDKQGLPGSLPAPGWLGRVGAGRVVVWAGHEGAFGTSQDGIEDNDAFRVRLIDWLRGSGTRVAFLSGHREWFGEDKLSAVVRAEMQGRGVSITSLGAPLDGAALERVDVLVFGNPWGPVSASELDAIAEWVRRGGAVLALGLGWSWPGWSADSTGGTYPLNQLGARLGFHVVNGAIDDPGATTGASSAPGYEFRTLDEFAPRSVRVLRASETDVGQVKALAAASPETRFVIEGTYMGLSLPTESWAKLNDPAAAVAALDKVYLAELAMVSGSNPPFGGANVWIVPGDQADEAWWMHSGNPIVYQSRAAVAEIIPHLNSEGHPGWGIAHELGHNFHSSTCGDLFVTEDTGEVWPNVFALASYRANGWDYRPQMGSELLNVGHRHHAEATPDFAALKADPFILLGCLDLIGKEHGWDGMRVFLTRAARDHAAGMTAGSEAERLAYWVDVMSESYQIDFAPLIAHWGFPVAKASFAKTSAYPPSPLMR